MLVRHYKGGLYRIIVEKAEVEANGEEMTVYISVETGKVWLRPYEEFWEWVPKKEDPNTLIPRFVEIEE
jgi:hypothetical protein